MSCLLGWDRGSGDLTAAGGPPRAPASGVLPGSALPAPTSKGNTFLTETAAQFVYYSKKSSIRKAFPAPSAPLCAEDIVPTDDIKRRYSLAAMAAAAKASGDEFDAMVAAGNAAAKDIGGGKKKIKLSKATEKLLRKKKKKTRKKRAPKIEGHKANFFNYGMNNTRGTHNYLQTHNVMPEDPREIYPNALHAAVRHPNADTAARAIAKAKFLKSHQESVSAAADDLLAALSRDAEEAAAAASAAKKSHLKKRGKLLSSNVRVSSRGDSKDAEIEDVSPHVRRTMISNPPQDPNVTMWDLLRWSDPVAEAKAKEALDAVKAANTVSAERKMAENSKRIVEAAKHNRKNMSGKRNKLARKVSSSNHCRMIRESSKKKSQLLRVDSEELLQFEKFEPQKIEMVDPKAFSNLPSTWTKNIPPAGKKSPPRPPSQLDDM